MSAEEINVQIVESNTTENTITEEQTETCILKDIYADTDRYDAMIPYTPAPLDPLTMVTPDKQTVQEMFEKMSAHPDFFDVLWKLPFFDFQFVLDYDLEDYVIGEKRDEYLKFKLKQRMKAKRANNGRKNV